MKFATHLCVFNQDRWLMKHLEMIYDHVEYIYISYSDRPWNYNPKAREQFKNGFNPKKLAETKYWNKIKLIYGEWDTEENQRNSCINVAKKDNIDFLFIIDTDEFYSNDSLNSLKKEIISNSKFDYYRTPWICYWKNFDYILVGENKSHICGYPEVAINLNSNVKFVRARRVNSEKYVTLNPICHHASYVLTDQECWEKINTWGHAHQFNTKNWYENIWLNWSEEKNNLHPITPNAWKKAIKRSKNVSLPEILE